MSISKSPRTPDRTKRTPGEPGQDREKSWRPTDEPPESDGSVEGEMEFDTEKFERDGSKSKRRDA